MGKKIVKEPAKDEMPNFGSMKASGALSGKRRTTEPPADGVLKPNLPPVPEVKVGPKSAVATFAAAGQSLKVVYLQGVLANKFKTGEAAFKKFKVNPKKGMLEGMTNLRAFEATRVVLTVPPGTSNSYYFRLVFTNDAGTTAGPPTGAIGPNSVQASEPTAKAPLTKAEEKAAKAKAAAEAKAAKAKAKEEAKAAKARQKEEAKLAKAARKSSIKSASAASSVEPASATAAKPKEQTKQAKTSKTSASAPTEPEAKKSPPKKMPDSKKASSRLGGGIDTSHLGESRLEKEERRRAEGGALFKKSAEEEQKSKIFAALNPEKLFYESSREKQENAEGIQVRARGTGSAAFSNGPDFTKFRDDEGNIVEESSSEEEDVGYEDGNVPDFGEFQGVLDEARKKRAEEEEKRKASLRKEWEAKKKKEEEERQKLLKKIAAEEAARAKKEELSAADVKAARERVSRESSRHLESFQW